MYCEAIIIGLKVHKEFNPKSFLAELVEKHQLDLEDELVKATLDHLTGICGHYVTSKVLMTQSMILVDNNDEMNAINHQASQVEEMLSSSVKVMIRDLTELLPETGNLIHVVIEESKRFKDNYKAAVEELKQFSQTSPKTGTLN